MSVWHLSYPLLPHDAMHKLGLCHHAVSVCLFVTFVHCVKTNKDIFKFFSPSRSHSILVFPHRTGWQYSDGNPPNGGVECRWGRVKSWNQWLSGLANCCTVFCTLRPPFCLRRVLDDQARCAVHSHGCPWLCTALDWPSAVSHCTPVVRESCVWQQGSTLRRRQHNRIEIVHTGKFEVEVTDSKKSALNVFIEAMKLTTDRHEASRGLFATAQLLVTDMLCSSVQYDCEWW